MLPLARVQISSMDPGSSFSETIISQHILRSTGIPSIPIPSSSASNLGCRWEAHFARTAPFSSAASSAWTREASSAQSFCLPDFAALSGIYPSPTYVNQISARTDIMLNQAQSLFVRYSHEGNFSYAPFGTLYPSTWPRQTGWTDQSIVGLTSQLGPRVVNDLRFSYFFVSFAQHAPKFEDCPTCLGIGAPLITVEDQLSIGFSSNNADLGRRYHLNDVVSWQRSPHHIRFGGDWETTEVATLGLAMNPLH